MSILTRLVSGIWREHRASAGAQAAAAACAEAVGLLNQGQTAPAQAAFERALRHDPRSHAALGGLGVLFHRLGIRARALEHLLRSLAIEPRSREIALLASRLLHDAGRSGDAIRLLDPVAAALPEDPAVGYQLAWLQRETGDLDGARRRLEGLGGRAGDHPGIVEELAVALRDCGEIDEALACYARLAELLPDQPRVASALLFHELYREHDRAALVARHQSWGERFAPPRVARDEHANVPDPQRVLRLGYLSADLGLTSAAPFIEPLLAHRDRSRFSVTCYHASGRDDEVTHRLRSLADAWRDVDALDDEALCERVREDGIDILVDLNGHSRGGRLTAFARRPAPVQATYLGYGATTGVAAIDYRLTDGSIDPEGEAERWYTEKLIRLPGAMWCFAPPREAPAVVAGPAAARAVLSFGSFNNFSKVGTGVLEAWAEIGAAVVDARFVLVGVPHGDTRRRVGEIFARRGVSAERLQFYGRVDPREYYALYGEVDVALDAFPYNGGTTTCDALWMGVPVLTFAGRGTLARSGLSLLTAAGMTEWVTFSKEAYVSKACALARDRASLGAMRAGMRGRVAASRLCNSERFMGGFEMALRGMWREWCEKQAGDRPA